MKDTIKNIINSNSEVFEGAFLMRKPSEEELAEAEKMLGFSIPDEYRWFLNEYGHGGFFFEFLGVGLNGRALFAEETLHEREYGLPHELMVIENCDEFVECIDTSSGKIVSWSKHDNDGIIERAEGFYEYFIECLDNAIENY